MTKIGRLIVDDGDSAMKLHGQSISVRCQKPLYRANAAKTVATTTAMTTATETTRRKCVSSNSMRLTKHRADNERRMAMEVRSRIECCADLAM